MVGVGDGWLVMVGGVGGSNGCHNTFFFCIFSFMLQLLSKHSQHFFYIFGRKYDYNNDTAWHNIRKKEIEIIFCSKLSEGDAMCIYLIFELSVEIDFFFFKNIHLTFCSSPLNRLFV